MHHHCSFKTTAAEEVSIDATMVSVILELESGTKLDESILDGKYVFALSQTLQSLIYR